MTITQLQQVEREIATIQPLANELLDKLQAISRAEARAMKASADWKIVDRWSELLTLRAKLRDAVEIKDVMDYPERYAE